MRVMTLRATMLAGDRGQSIVEALVRRTLRKIDTKNEVLESWILPHII